MENTKTTRLLLKDNWILAYFWHLNWRNFGYFGEKLQNNTLKKADRSLSKRTNIHTSQYEIKAL